MGLSKKQGMEIVDGFVEIVTAEMRKGFEEMVNVAKTSTAKVSEDFEKMGRKINEVGSWMLTSATRFLCGCTSCSSQGEGFCSPA